MEAEPVVQLHSSLLDETRRAVQAPRVPHPTLEALTQLGVRSVVAAESIGVSAPLFSLWRSGAARIPQKHERALVGVLRVAIDAATRALGETAIYELTPAEKAAHAIYALRVRRARQILNELEGVGNAAA